MTSSFSNKFLLLQQEGFLFSGCIFSGLNHLIKANIGEKSDFYVSMFNLSIGLERIMKVALQMDHMLRNKMETLTVGQMKGFGHKLTDLYTAVRDISKMRGKPFQELKNTKSHVSGVVTLLSEFAVATRYHNLDELAGSSNHRDPLAGWDSIITSVIDTTLPRRVKERAWRDSSMLQSMMENNILVRSMDLRMVPIAGMDVAAKRPFYGAAMPYIITDLVLEILVPLRILLRMLSYDPANSAPDIPHMHEFLLRIPDDRRTLLKKKRWP